MSLTACVLVCMAAFGTLTGTIAEALAADENCSNDPIEDTGNAVCVYEGVVDVPLDIRAAQTDPVATAITGRCGARWRPGLQPYHYRVISCARPGTG